MNNLRLVLARRNLLPTLLVIIASLVMVRLGFWQLDRLAQRRAFNERVLSAVYAEPLVLGEDALELNLYDMEYRTVNVTGAYSFEDQVALRLQQRGSEPGVHLLTPLHVEGTDSYILVDRGWIPLAQADPSAWAQFDIPDEAQPTAVEARIRRAQPAPDFGERVDPTLAPGQQRLDEWFAVDPARVAEQSGLNMVADVYLQELPAEGQGEAFPFPQAEPVEVSEGPHLGYAFQWFSFAGILLIGYPIFLVRQARDEERDED